MLKKIFDSRVVRFIFVGSLNSLFGFTVFSVIAYMGGQTWKALLGGNVAGIAFNFLTTGGIVFRDLSMKCLLRFIVAYLSLFLFNLGAIELLTDVIQIDRIFVQALLTLPMAIMSWFIMSRLVFLSQ